MSFLQLGEFCIAGGCKGPRAATNKMQPQGRACWQRQQMLAANKPTPDEVTLFGLGLAFPIQLARKLKGCAGGDAIYRHRCAPAAGSPIAVRCRSKVHRGLRPHRKAMGLCKGQRGDPLLLATATALDARCRSCGGRSAASRRAVGLALSCACRFQLTADARHLPLRALHCLSTIVNMDSDLRMVQKNQECAVRGPRQHCYPAGLPVAACNKQG